MELSRLKRMSPHAHGTANNVKNLDSQQMLRVFIFIDCNFAYSFQTN